MKPNVAHAMALLAWRQADPATRGPCPVHPGVPASVRMGTASPGGGELIPQKKFTAIMDAERRLKDLYRDGEPVTARAVNARHTPSYRKRAGER